MKFLHISDLHIGKVLNGISLIPDQAHIFAQIIAYIQTHQPQAIVIAGDVYDRALPSAEAVSLFDQFITDLAAQGVVVLLVAGNHDSPQRMDYASRLLVQNHLHFAGAFKGAMEKVTLTDPHGEVNFWLLPFIKPLLTREVLEDIDTYDGIITAAISNSAIDFTQRNVLISHQFYTKMGEESTRSESERDPIGGLDGVDATIVQGFDYVALGHLHGQQRVGEEHIRYSGSPLKYSFSEVNQAKAVLMVDIGEKGQVQTTALPLAPLHDMEIIEGTMETLLESTSENYIKAIFTNEEYILDPMGKLRVNYPNIMEAVPKKSLAETISGEGADLNAITQLSTYELFAEFFLNTQGSTLTAEQADIIVKLLEEDVE